VNYKSKSRRRFFSLVRSRSPPISSEFRGVGGLNTPNPPSVRHWCETCRVSSQNKFVKLVHLVGFIIKKFVTMYGHMIVKSNRLCSLSMTRAQEVHAKQILVQPLQYFSLSVRLHSTRLGSWSRDLRKVMKLNLPFLSLESIVIMWILW